MKRPSIALASALVAGPLLLSTAAGIAHAAETPSVKALTADELPKLLPGLPPDALTPKQREVLLQVLSEEFSYCGSPHTIAGALAGHKACRHAPRMALLAARLAKASYSRGEIHKIFADYYGSFDRSKRARIDTQEFGPPLGNAKAPISIVEFSDFTCPYCQLLRPELEKWIEAHQDRARLYFKPFPIAGHHRAMEAAQAVEWARDKGIFWKMHDLVFGHPYALSDDDLAAYAEQAGGDRSDLQKALETERFKSRILGAQAEARAAGLDSTPTLFFEGRRYTIPDLSPAGLEFTLEDEEEWQKNGGWTKD